MITKRKNIIMITLSLILIFSLVTTAYAADRYTVKVGDSLYKISSRYNTTISELVRVNNITNANLIYPGRTIKLPTEPQRTSPNSSTATDDVSSQDSSVKYNEKTSSNNSATYTDRKWQQKENVVKAKRRVEPIKRIYRKGPNTMQIALTFDDGPDSVFTPQILKILKDNNVKATFFVVGNRVKKNPGIVKRIMEDGHTIANHSWSHPDLSKLTEEEVSKEVIDTEKAIKKIIGRETALIRPPYGAVSDDLLDQLKEMNYKVIHWSIDSLDWRASKKEDVLDRTLPKLHEGAIILFHSAGGEGQSLAPTIDALPTIINTLRDKGVRLVTADDLLSISAYKG